MIVPPSVSVTVSCVSGCTAVQVPSSARIAAISRPKLATVTMPSMGTYMADHMVFPSSSMVMVRVYNVAVLGRDSSAALDTHIADPVRAVLGLRDRHVPAVVTEHDLYAVRHLEDRRPLVILERQQVLAAVLGFHLAAGEGFPVQGVAAPFGRHQRHRAAVLAEGHLDRLRLERWRRRRWCRG